MQQINILIVDDDPADSELLARALAKVELCEFAIRDALTLPDALSLIRDSEPDLVFLDCRIPPHTLPSETVAPIRETGYKGPIVIMSGVSRNELPESEKHLENYPYVCKSDLNVPVLSDLIGELVRAA